MHQYFEDKQKHSEDTVTVIEKTKVVDITDKFGVVRFKVALDEYKDKFFYDHVYEVEVITCYMKEYPIVVFNRKPIKNYGDAISIFNQCVEDYTRIVELETSDIYDITMLRYDIGYKQISCCLNCEFCKHINPRTDHYPFDMILECHNPKIFQCTTGDLGSDHTSDDRYMDMPEHLHCKKEDFDRFEKEHGFRPKHYGEIYDNEEYRWKPYHENAPINFHPTVNADAVCDYYLKKQCHHHDKKPIKPPYPFK